MVVKINLDMEVTMIKEAGTYTVVDIFKHKDLKAKIENYNEVRFKFYTGQYDRRIKQIEKLGFKQKEIIRDKGLRPQDTVLIVFER